MKVYIDIDKTICTEVEGDNYQEAKPIKKTIAKANAFYEAGHTIIYWTARGSGTGKDWLQFTISQLEGWGAKFHDVKVGKPEYDRLIDDKNFRPEESAAWQE